MVSLVLDLDILFCLDVVFEGFWPEIDLRIDGNEALVGVLFLFSKLSKYSRMF